MACGGEYPVDTFKMKMAYANGGYISYAIRHLFIRVSDSRCFLLIVPLTFLSLVCIQSEVLPSLHLRSAVV